MSSETLQVTKNVKFPKNTMKSSLAGKVPKLRYLLEKLRPDVAKGEPDT